MALKIIKCCINICWHSWIVSYHKRGKHYIFLECFYLSKNVNLLKCHWTIWQVTWYSQSAWAWKLSSVTEASHLISLSLHLTIFKKKKKRLLIYSFGCSEPYLWHVGSLIFVVAEIWEISGTVSHPHPLLQSIPEALWTCKYLWSLFLTGLQAPQ